MGICQMRLLVRSLVIIMVVSDLCSFFNSTFKGVNNMARLTHSNYDSTMAAMNFTPSLQQLVSMGAEIGLPEWYMIMLIGTTEGEGYVYDYYLNYEWACTVINYILESYDLRWNDKTWVYNYIRGWDDETVRPGDLNYYSEYRVTQRYYNCTADNRKVVYLAMMNRDRNTRACSGDYYDGGYYAYYTSAQYPAVSVWYLTGGTIVDDSGVTPGGGSTFTFTERLTSPEGEYSPCYMTTSVNEYLGVFDSTHWNTCRAGSPMLTGATSLANCTGYAEGRSLEAYCEGTGYDPVQTGTQPWLIFSSHNAAEWYDVAEQSGVFTVNPTVPAPGAIMVWGPDWAPASAAGHVAFVESVVDNDTLIVTESGFDGIAGRTWLRQNRYRGNDGLWSGDLFNMGGYSWLGFIYNLGGFTPVPPTPTPGKSKSKIIYQRNWNNHTFRRLLG